MECVLVDKQIKMSDQNLKMFWKQLLYSVAESL